MSYDPADHVPPPPKCPKCGARGPNIEVNDGETDEYGFVIHPSFCVCLKCGEHWS